MLSPPPSSNLLGRLLLAGLVSGALASACGGRSLIYGDEFEGDPPLVGCSIADDCADDETCRGGVCRAECSSWETACPAEAPYCDVDWGVCVACLDGLGCTDGQVCREGVCVAAGCDVGVSQCSGNQIETCGDQGEWVITASCGLGQQCTSDRGGAYCLDLPQLCEPGSSVCIGETAFNVCSTDGLSYQPGDCATIAQVCRDGTCVTNTCTAGQLYCENNGIRLCSADGTSSTIWEACDQNERCVDGGMPYCETLVCTPNAKSCSANVAYQCNAEGTSLTVAEDCGAGVCKQGECFPIICNPNTYACSPSGDVVLCSSDGTVSTVADDCSSTEYCQAGQATCRPQVCSPGASWCDGSNVVTCNAQGSGSSVTSCLPESCTFGTCDGDLFAENFEDGNADGWTTVSSDYVSEVVTSPAADGTGHSFTMSGGNGDHYNGVYYDLPEAIAPERFSYWARAEGTGHSTYLTLHATTGTPSLTTEVAFVYFREGGSIAVGGSSQSIAVASYTPGVWYFIELEFDWASSTYDIYIDGDIGAQDIDFRGGSESGVSRISLYHYAPGTGYWDEMRAY